MVAASLCMLCTSALFAAADDVRYAGRSVEEWRALIGRIELQSPQSRDYVPGLIALMNDPHVPWITRRQAALTLGRLGPFAREAVPEVLRHLNEVDADDPEISPQRWALSSLALYGREAAIAAPQLIQLLNETSQPVVTRLGCLEALSQIGSAAPQAIPAVWSVLERQLTRPDDTHQELAIGAAEALGMVGPDAGAAVPVLMRAAQVPSEDLRREAIRALGRIGSAAQDAQPLLCDVLLSDESELVRDLAAQALGQTGPTSWPLVEPLFSADESSVRERAVQAVAGWKSAGKQIVPVIETLLSDDDPKVRLAATRSWRALTDRYDAVWPVLVELLTHPDRDLRRGALKVLQDIAASQAISETLLQSLATHPDAAVQKAGLRLQQLQRLRQVELN